MSKLDDGYILIDTIIALLILFLSLTSVYGLITKTLNYQSKVKEHIETRLVEIETKGIKTYDLIKE